MNVLFACGQAMPPQFLGGSNISVLSVARRLRLRGHTVNLLCGLWGSGYLPWRNKLLMKLTRRPLIMDRTLGLPTYRVWLPWECIDVAVEKLEPDVVVIPAHRPVRMALAARKAGVKLLMLLQDFEVSGHDGDFSQLGDVPCIANSRFTATAYEKAYGVSPTVVHPIIDRDQYQTATSRENVTFVNPDPKKGMDIALHVARACPDVPFAFYQSWPLAPEVHKFLLAEVSNLPNVTLHPAIADMRQVYSKTKILLTPSRWEEAFGRVVAEAHFSGIPAVASNIGGLPEAVGPGGVLVDPKGPVEAWVEAVRRLWDDQALYADLSSAALNYSTRSEMNPASQVKAWEARLRSAAEQ